MIVIINIGDEIVVSVDDECPGEYHPVRTSELCTRAVEVLDQTLSVCAAQKPPTKKR